MCRCLIKGCTAINRIFNLILSLVGLAALSYGIFILSKTNWILSIFPLSVTTWGSLLFFCTLTYATCGYKSSCCGGCYVLLMLLFFLVNAIGVIFYFTHETEAIQYLNQTLVDVPVSVDSYFLFWMHVLYFWLVKSKLWFQSMSKQELFLISYYFNSFLTDPFLTQPLNTLNTWNTFFLLFFQISSSRLYYI